MLTRKQNVLDDFSSAARYLFESRYTNPGKLAIRGTSNGGLHQPTPVRGEPRKQDHARLCLKGRGHDERSRARFRAQAFARTSVGKGPRVWGLFWLTFAIAIGVGQFLVHGRRTQELVAENNVDPEVPITGDMPRVTQEAAPAVVRVVAGWLAVAPGESTAGFIGQSGSGFFVDPNGYIATSANVVTGDTVDDERYARNILLERIQADAESPLHALNDLWRRLIRVQMKPVSYAFLPDGKLLPFAATSTFPEHTRTTPIHVCPPSLITPDLHRHRPHSRQLAHGAADENIELLVVGIWHTGGAGRLLRRGL